MIWRHEGKKCHQACDTEEQAKTFKALIEQVNGDAEKAVAALTRQASHKPTLSEVAEAHISRLADTEGYTKQKYRETVASKFGPLDHPVDMITEDDVQGWVTWMSSEAYDGKGYSPKTIRNAHGLLYSVFAYSVR